MEKPGVLIVDDEQIILDNLAEFFRHDFSIYTANGVDRALEILASAKISVIVSDFKMPGKDGLSFLIEAKKKYPKTIRVLMTAYADMNLVVRAMNEGEINRFISKPFKSFEFRQILEECLKLSSILEKNDEPVKKGKTVLVGHDSQITLSTLRLLLSTSYRILSTANGLEVLSTVSTSGVDALILGIGLEMMDGCTIASYLKKERKVTFPIVIWSRGISGPLEEYLKECGVDAWFDDDHPSASSDLQKYLKEILR